MSVIAIPVPSEPKPLPNRWVWVSNIPSGEHRYHTDDASDRPFPDGSPPHNWGLYVLPGTALAAALAELERASDAFDECDLTNWRGVISRFREARRNVKALTPKGTNP